MTRCPKCQSEPIPINDQPQPSLHAATTIYKCDSQVVFVIEGNYWEWVKECTVESNADDK